MTRTRALVSVALLPLVLAGCASTSTEDVNERACDAFAYYLRQADGQPEAMDRKTTVEQVAAEVEGDVPPDQRIADALGVLQNGVDASVDGWVIGADTFAAACLDLGWEG